MTDRTGPAALRTDGDAGPGFLTVSNVLSLVRIPLGVAFLAVHETRWLAALVAAGALSDLLDGWIARLTGTMSEIGALLDPFCDRIFVLLALLSFLPTDRLDWAGFLILILRDIYTGGVFIVSTVAGHRHAFHSRQGGRITTALQLAALAAILFAPVFAKMLIILVGISSVYAIIDYGTAGMREQGWYGPGQQPPRPAPGR